MATAILLLLCILFNVFQQCITGLPFLQTRRSFVKRRYDRVVNTISTSYKTTREPLSPSGTADFDTWKESRCPVKLPRSTQVYSQQRCILSRTETSYAPFSAASRSETDQKIDDDSTQYEERFPTLSYRCKGLTITFIAIGNAGIPGFRDANSNSNEAGVDPLHKQIGQDFVRVVRKHDAQFALLLGNTFYDGVESVDDPQWESVWAKRFEVEKLNIPFFAVNGNREKMKNNTATGCYGEYGTHSKHWILPDMAYSVNVMNAAGDFKMIFTDTEVETKEIKYAESGSGNAEWPYFDSLKDIEIQSIFKPGKGTSSEPALRKYTAPDVTWMAEEQKRYEKWKHPKTSMIIMVGHRHLNSTLEPDTKVYVTDHIINEDTVHRYVQNAKVTSLPLNVNYDTYISGDVPGMEYFKEHDNRNYFGIGGGGGESVSKWKTFQQKWLKGKPSKGSDTKRSKFAKYVYGFAVFEYNFKMKTEKVLYYLYDKKNGVYTLRKDPQVIKDGVISKHSLDAWRAEESLRDTYYGDRPRPLLKKRTSTGSMHTL